MQVHGTVGIVDILIQTIPYQARMGLVGDCLLKDCRPFTGIFLYQPKDLPK